jgi:hypothetical protein
MIAEYLDLIVGVTDHFTDDLAKLVGTLEHIDNNYDPFIVDVYVNVHDRELDSLQRQLSASQALGLGNVPTASPSGSGGQVAETSGGFLRISDEEMQRMGEIFGESATKKTLMNKNFTVLDAMSGSDTPMFGVTQSDMKRNFNFDGENLSRAMDWDSLLTDMSVSMGRPASMADLTQIDSLDSLGLEKTDYINMGKIKRLRFQDTLKNMRVGMTQFYDILAAFMPLLFTFVGAMPAAIAGLGALATAALGAAAGLAGIAGLGFLGAAMSEAGGGMPSGEDFREVLSDIPDEFFEAFSGLAQRLEPTFNAGLEGLYEFFDELAARGDALVQLTDDAKALGNFLLEFVPNGLQMLALFTDAASPVFSLLADELGDRDILAGLAMSLQTTLPYLYQLMNTVLDALPGIVKFSTGMLMWANAILRVVVGIGGLVTALAEFLPFINNGNKAVGLMVGTLLTLTSVTLLASKVYAIYTSELIGMIAAQLTANGSIIATIANMTSLAGIIVGSLIPSINGFTISVQAATWAIRGLLAVTGIGLAIAGIGYIFEQTSKKIDKATSSLGDFQDTYSSLDGGGIKAGVQGASASGGYVNYTDNSNTTINAPDRSTGEELSQYSAYQDWASNESDFSTL